VDLAPLKELAQPVTLAAVKGDKVLSGSLLVKQSRISVVPLTELQAKRFLELAQTKLG
jgi:predicted RNA-binding protein with PUA-like domain